MSEDRTLETWTYVGKSLLRGGKVGYAWLLPDGTRVAYSKFRASIVGGQYTVSVARTADSTMVYGEPSWTGDRHPDLDEVAVWQAEDAKVSRDQRQAAEERKAAANGPLEDALRDLLQIAAACKTWDQRDALEAHVTRELRKAFRNS